jgi:hypothetical protein
MNTNEQDTVSTVEDTSPAAVQSAVEKLVEEMGETVTIEGEVQVLSDDDAATLQAIEAEIEADAAKDAVYAAQESDGDTTIVPEEAPATVTKAKREKKAAAPKAPKAPRPSFDTISAAVTHKIGGIENLVLTASDASLDAAGLEAMRADALAKFDGSAKKVGEKIVNIFAASVGKAKLSEFTQTALKALAGGSTSSKAIYEAMKADGYSDGTARSQSQQMMHLLPLVGIATRTKSDLTLNAESVLFTALAGKF